ncbi:Hypothetical protein A7982_02528 [Minicystis rosea]|nr:Hypothetical protein A7982_02528 [Minicystis rosea]
MVATTRSTRHQASKRPPGRASPANARKHDHDASGRARAARLLRLGHRAFVRGIDPVMRHAS